MELIDGTTNPLLLIALEDILRGADKGLREIEIINALDKHYHHIFPKRELSDSLTLFQTHFVLMNALHTLRIQLWQNENGHLDIGPIVIKLYPYNYLAHERSLDQPDHTSEYYLNWDNLAGTSKEDVEKLIWSFWEDMAADSFKDDALGTLNLTYPCTWQDIKIQYRRLAMQHHPDRGGSKQKLQEINEAFESLKKAFRNRADGQD